MRRWSPNMQKVLELTKEDIAYIAGFFDGEGSITLYKNGNRPACKLTVCQKRGDVIHWLHSVFSGSATVRYRKTPAGDDTHLHEWNVNGFDGPLFILKLLRPYLRVKALEADIAVSVLENISTLTIEEFETKIIDLKNSRKVS